MHAARRHPLFVALLALLLALAPFVHGHRGPAPMNGWHVDVGDLGSRSGTTHFSTDDSTVTVAVAAAQTRPSGAVLAAAQLPELAPPPAPLRLVQPRGWRAVASTCPSMPSGHRACGLLPPAAAPPTTA